MVDTKSKKVVNSEGKGSGRNLERGIIVLHRYQ